MITFFYLQKPDGPCYARMRHHILPNGSEGHLKLANAAQLHLLPGSSFAESLPLDKIDETYISGEAHIKFTKKGRYVLFADDLQLDVEQGEIHVIAYPECRHLLIDTFTAELKISYLGKTIHLKAGQQLLLDRTLRLPLIRNQNDNCPPLNCLPIDICIAILSRKFDCKIELAPEMDLAHLVIFNRDAANVKQALVPVCEQLNMKMSMHEGRIKLST